MTAKMLTIATAAAALLGAPAAFAATEIDADGDGMISFEEMLAVMPSITEETFLQVDGNADGLVDATELAAAQEAGVIPADIQG